jgi:hypothetical protein
MLSNRSHGRDDVPPQFITDGEWYEGRMVRLSTMVILAGIVLLFVPIPPIATILGIIVLVFGIALRLLTGK